MENQIINADENITELADSKENINLSNCPDLSKVYKIKVLNIPYYSSYQTLEKLLKKTLKLKFHKIKLCGPKSNTCYVTFKNNDDEQKAIQTINGFTYRKKILESKSVSSQENSLEKFQKNFRENQEMKCNICNEDKIRDATCPLSKFSYEDQLVKKQLMIENVIKTLESKVAKLHKNLKDYLKTKPKDNKTLTQICNIIESPSINYYRNKCEFTVGYMTTKENIIIPSVGFRSSSFKSGDLEVISIKSLENLSATLPHIPLKMLKIAMKFEQYVTTSEVVPYCEKNQQGNWKNLIIRCSRGANFDSTKSSTYDQDIQQIMVMVECYTKDLENDTIIKIKNDIKHLFSSEYDQEDYVVTSLFFNALDKNKTEKIDSLPELLFGTSYIQETLLGRSFNISPKSFFQVNTLAAEVLYKNCGDIANLDKNSILLDAFCGTGTIGLSLADRAKKVIGIDCIDDAIKDAENNSEINGYKNCFYFTSRVEDVLENVLTDIKKENIVTILDPPRAGLHKKALKTIRNCTDINTLVYISCDAKQAMNNFIDLARPPSNYYQGNPFLPKKVIPVDLFPHTSSFELIVLLERIQWDEIDVSGNDALNTQEKNS